MFFVLARMNENPSGVPIAILPALLYSKNVQFSNDDFPYLTLAPTNCSLGCLCPIKWELATPSAVSS